MSWFNPCRCLPLEGFQLKDYVLKADLLVVPRATDKTVEIVMGIGDSYKVFFQIDWSQPFIQLLEMIWYCCCKLWTLFTNHYYSSENRE